MRFLTTNFKVFLFCLLGVVVGAAAHIKLHTCTDSSKPFTDALERHYKGQLLRSQERNTALLTTIDLLNYEVEVQDSLLASLAYSEPDTNKSLRHLKEWYGGFIGDTSGIYASVAISDEE